MKYDLVSAIKDKLATTSNDSKNCINLDDKYISIINFIQNQNFPELDGLHLITLPKYDPETDQISVMLYNKQCHQFMLECTHQNDEAKVIISKIGNTFFLEYTILQSGFDTFNCTYTYENDIIKICNESYKGNFLFNLYTNVADDKDITRDSHGIPVGLIPDYSLLCNYRDNTINIKNYPRYKYETIIRDFRIACNEIAERFHQENEDYMKINK